MKYLLILAIVLLVVWLWRSGRRHASDDETPRSEDQPHEMVRCAHCGVHLPRSDAVPGQRALYCSPEHRLNAEP